MIKHNSDSTAVNNAIKQAIVDGPCVEFDRNGNDVCDINRIEISDFYPEMWRQGQIQRKLFEDSAPTPNAVAGSGAFDTAAADEYYFPRRNLTRFDSRYGWYQPQNYRYDGLTIFFYIRLRWGHGDMIIENMFRYTNFKRLTMLVENNLNAVSGIKPDGTSINIGYAADPNTEYEISWLTPGVLTSTSTTLTTSTTQGFGAASGARTTTRWVWGASPAPSPYASQLFPVCFPGDSVVQIDGQGSKPMEKVRVGDSVMVKSGTGEFKYEPVLSFLHTSQAGPGSKSNYLTIRHSQGIFQASANHIVFVKVDEKMGDKIAKDLKVGDELITGQGETSTILSVHHISGEVSMHAPLTDSGTVVVDGVVASVYATSPMGLRLPHSSVHATFFPVRLIHRLGFANLPSVFAAMFGLTAKEEFPAEYHPFSDFLYNRLGMERVHKLITTV